MKLIVGIDGMGIGVFGPNTGQERLIWACSFRLPSVMVRELWHLELLLAVETEA